MIEARFHGRAGQGIVTAAELLAFAASYEGKFTQAFPFFGSEKRGPPVTSFCRIDEAPIKLHEEIAEPDIVIVTDKTILPSVNVESGLKGEGIIIINSADGAKKLFKTKNVFSVDGTEIAVKYFSRPITNTVLLGALSKVTEIVKIESIERAIQERFKGEIAEKNVKAIQECYKKVKK